MNTIYHRNVTSEVTAEEVALAEAIHSAMWQANACPVQDHAYEMAGRAYGDLKVALLNLLSRLYGRDGREVYETMVDTGEGVAWCVGAIISERVPEPCSECGSLVYDNDTLQAAAEGRIELDRAPTHCCELERVLADRAHDGDIETVIRSGIFPMESPAAKRALVLWLLVHAPAGEPVSAEYPTHRLYGRARALIQRPHEGLRP